MKDSNDFERFVADQFAREPRGPAPTDEAIHDLLTKAGHARQRPRWLAILKEPPMRHASRVVVGSPAARVTALAATTLLMALLATAALVVGAQSPSPAPPETGAVPLPPVEFTGTACWFGPPVAPDRSGTETTIELGDEGLVLTRNRRGAWRNQVALSDPRLQGAAYQTYESDAYAMPGSASGPAIVASTLSIVNEDGAWVSADYQATANGSETTVPPVNVFVGQGAYEGLIAIMEVVPAGGDCEVQGVIVDGPPVLEPYLPE